MKTDKKHKCLCGCGNITIKSNRGDYYNYYIRYHNRRHKIPWNKGRKGLQKCSKETRIKMSKSRKGKPKSIMHKIRIGLGNKGKRKGMKLPIQWRRNISLAQTGVPSNKRGKHYIKASIARIRMILENNGVVPWNKKYVCKKYYSNKNKQNLYYQSSYELQAFKILENDKSVKTYKRSNNVIDYVYDESTHKYIPDIFVEYDDSKISIIEVKAKWDMKNLKNKLKFKAARKYCKNNGYNFEIWSENELFCR